MAAVVSPFGTATFHSGVERRQVVELLDIMSPTTVPLLKLIGIDGEPGTNPKLEWLEDTLLAEASTSLGTFNTGATTLNVKAGDGVNFQPFEVIKITDSAGVNATEYLYVTAVVTDALTVVRAVAGTSDPGTNYATLSTIEIVGLANKENVDSPSKAATDISTPYNYFQEFDTSYQISYKAANTDVYGVPEGDDSRELDKAFKEIVVKLERTAVLGKRAAASGAVPNLMGGLDYFLSSSYGTNHFAPASLSGADLEEKDINDVLQGMFYSVGQDNMAKTIICGVWNQRRINDLFAPYARTTRNERVGGVVVTTIDSLFGAIDVVFSLRCPKDTVYFVNLDFIQVNPYRGLAFFDQELSRNGAYIKRQIYGSYTMTFRNSKSMGVLRGTSTA